MLQVVPVDTPPVVPLAVAPVLQPVLHSIHPHIPLQQNHVPIGSSRKVISLYVNLNTLLSISFSYFPNSESS